MARRACACAFVCCTNFPDNLISAHPSVNPRRHTCTHERTHTGRIIATSALIILCARARRRAPISLGAKAPQQQQQQQLLLQSLRSHPDATATVAGCCAVNSCTRYSLGAHLRRGGGVVTCSPQQQKRPPPSPPTSKCARCTTLRLCYDVDANGIINCIQTRNNIPHDEATRKRVHTQRYTYILWISS